MRVKGTRLAVCVLLGSVAYGAPSEAAAPKHGRAGHHAAGRTTLHHAHAGRGSHHAGAPRHGRRTYAGGGGGGGGISCVPYARAVTGMAIAGNGGTWWNHAEGAYDRGNRPEPGSVMAFRASAGMRLGHVAVVSRVLGSRQVLIDHANWGGPGIRPGQIMHNVSVVDVSDDNDWTAVRVQVGYDNGSFGRVYPTYGFIYNRPETDTRLCVRPGAGPEAGTGCRDAVLGRAECFLPAAGPGAAAQHGGTSPALKAGDVAGGDSAARRPLRRPATMAALPA